MAELGVAASIVGLVVPALHGVKLLLEDIENLKDAPKTIKRLSDEAQSVESALSLLRNVGDRELGLLGTLIAEQSEITISTCTSACNQFRIDLQRWTRHSDDGKLALVDRAKVGFLKQGHIKTMSAQLQNCKISVTSMVSVATLYSSTRHTHITEEIREMISSRQTEVCSAIATTDKQTAVVEYLFTELERDDDDDDDDETEAGSVKNKEEALQQLQDERKALDSSRKLLQELLSRSQEKVIARTAGSEDGDARVIFGSHNSGFQAHTINGTITGMSFGQR